MKSQKNLNLYLNISIISGIFCVFVSVLLFLNYLQFSKNDPLETTTIELLVEKLSDEPNNNELKLEIRDLDTLARKAYFNSRWQVKTGAFLLLFGAIVFTISLRYYYNLRSRIEEPELIKEDDLKARILSQRWLMIAAGIVLIVALIASYASINYLELYETGGQLVQDAEIIDNQVEVIEIGSPSGKTEPVVSTEETADNENDVIETVVVDQEGINNISEDEAVPEVTTPVQPTISFEESIKNQHNAFRGPFSNGIIYHENIPTYWDGATGENVLWKLEIPRQGYNSPVLWDDKIFITGADEESRDVYCVDANTGQILWTGHADNIPGSPAEMPRVSEDTGLAAPTTTTDGKNVFAIFATGDIISLDMEGNRQWARNLGVPDNHYGHASSLVCWEDKVYVQYDTADGCKLIALNTSTGETIWETIRSNSLISWASPIIAKINNAYQIILAGEPMLAGYDIETGALQWEVECLSGEVGSSPAYGEGLVFAGNEYAIFAGVNPLTGEIVWEDDEYLPEIPSAVVYNGLVWIATTWGVVACYDAKTGEFLYEKEANRGFYSSPVIVEGKVYISDYSGTMHIFEATREGNDVSESVLSEDCYTIPAFSNGRIYIRGDINLYCIGSN